MRDWVAAGIAPSVILRCAMAHRRRASWREPSGASRRENVASYSVVIVREGGRSSIPETRMIEPINRGVLDPPACAGDDHGVLRRSPRNDALIPRDDFALVAMNGLDVG